MNIKHPAKFSDSILNFLYSYIPKRGCKVLDPFAGTGKLKKDLTDRPFKSFTPIVDENNAKSLAVSKKLNQDIKRDFYLARRMSGIEFPSGLVSLRIVLQ